MNNENMQLMSTMLGEVVAGDWKGTPVDHNLIIGPVKLFPVNVVGFDIETWAEEVTNSNGKTCGYSACAVGHACFDPRFQALGLAMDRNTIPMLIDGDINYRWDAVCRLFDINIDTAKSLFLDKNYENYIKFHIKPGQVKSRVDELLVIGEDAFNAKYPNVSDINPNEPVVIG